jgi:hypothetical protein
MPMRITIQTIIGSHQDDSTVTYLDDVNSTLLQEVLFIDYIYEPHAVIFHSAYTRWRILLPSTPVKGNLQG